MGGLLLMTQHMQLLSGQVPESLHFCKPTQQHAQPSDLFSKAYSLCGMAWTCCMAYIQALD
jgi:hypothetical protein